MDLTTTSDIIILVLRMTSAIVISVPPTTSIIIIPVLPTTSILFQIANLQSKNLFQMKFILRSLNA